MKDYNFGIKGEEIAKDDLIKKGYNIREINWRFNHKEIDIIAEKDDILVFIEVKTRSTSYFENPEEAVSLKKQRNIIDAAEAYIIENDIDRESRFDIIGIIMNNGSKKIEHIEGAFVPLV